MGGGTLPCAAQMSRNAVASRMPMSGARRQCDASAAVTIAVCGAAERKVSCDKACATRRCFVKLGVRQGSG